ncbi:MULTISPECIES: YceD family protein [Aphanothece]|uniref:YceD family protein n=1 Tax=Aphanothece TaxID=1121 RepID=UPI00398566A1
MSVDPACPPAGPRGSASDLRPIPIQDLRGLAEGRTWTVEQHLEGLASLTPVRGALRAVHCGNVLAVDGRATTILTLRCDRCLQHFNHPLGFHTRELIWLGEAARQQGVDSELLEGPATELELDPDALTESLDPRGHFDPAHWIFEQLSLQLPLVNDCGEECPGPSTWSSDASRGDPRWAALAALREPPQDTP